MMRLFDVIKLPFAVAGAFVGALGLPGCWDAIKGCLAEARALSRTCGRHTVCKPLRRKVMA